MQTNGRVDILNYNPYDRFNLHDKIYKQNVIPERLSCCKIMIKLLLIFIVNSRKFVIPTFSFPCHIWDRFSSDFDSILAPTIH